MMNNQCLAKFGRVLIAVLSLVAGARISHAADAQPTAAACRAVITLESLLQEMVDRDALARWPNPPYTCRQASSWDRGSVAPDKPGWFANMDTGQYLRTETNHGRAESVMMDARGPGCIVRWWAGGTTPQMGPPGTIRIYLDGADTPAFEGQMDTLVNPDWLVGPPLGAIRCIGRNLYLPIPYAKHCKVTYDRPPLDEMGNAGNRHWYVINYRTYPPGTAVRSFTLDDLKQAKPTLDRVSQRLLTPANEPLDNATWIAPQHRRLEHGQSLTQTITGARAIRRLSVQVRGTDLARALRSTVLVITCDGEQTVWCPVGDFFGSGVGLNPFRDWWRDVDRSGLLTCWWVMPQRESCCLELLNLGAEPVEATLGLIAHTPWSWDDRSLHYQANWRQQTGIDTRRADGTMDWNYINATGQGIYVGDTLALHNGAGPWWGEGDEKVYVDGESFPSHFGTGTEDYYGYSYGDQGTFFESPFHAEPRWEGNRKPGFVTVTRTRGLDAIPFTKSLKFDMEVWHWTATKMTCAAATYWYARPGARSNRGAQPDEAARPPEELRNRVPGVCEGEELRIKNKTGGVTELQSQPEWSNGQQLWWRDAKPGDKLELILPVAKAGRYELRMHNTYAFDYGVFQFWLDDAKLGEPLDLYAQPNAYKSVTLGVRELSAGQHVFTAEIVGSNPAAKPRHMLGLDYLRLEPVKR
jgi:hypothetical protein